MVVSALLVGAGRRPGQRRAHRLRQARAPSSPRWRCSRPPAASPRSSPRPADPDRHRARLPRLLRRATSSASRCWSHLRRWSSLVGWILLNRTTFGRRTFAVGGNAEAARLAGIRVQRHTVLLYVLSGLCCGIAAVMLMARTTTGSSTTHGDALRARRHRRRRHRRHAADRRPRHDRRHRPRRADLHDAHQRLHPEQPVQLAQNVAKGVIIVARRAAAAAGRQPAAAHPAHPRPRATPVRSPGRRPTAR